MPMTYAQRAICDHILGIANSDPDRFARLIPGNRDFDDTDLAALIDYFYDKALPTNGDDLEIAANYI